MTSPERGRERGGRSGIRGRSLGSRMAAAACSLHDLVSHCMETVFSSRRTGDTLLPLISYVRSTILTCNASALRASQHLYPCPPPYPWHDPRPGGSRRGQRKWRDRRNTELLVNLVAVTLSHISQGFTGLANNGGRSGAPLNRLQEAMVTTITTRVKSMRRFLNKSDCGASLERLAAAGDTVTKCMGAIEIIPYGRLRQRAQEPRAMAEQGVGGFAGGARPGPMIAARIDIPGVLSLFDMEGLLSPESLEGLERPDSLLIPDEDLPPPLPRGKMVSKRELFLLGKRWDQIDKARLVLASDIDERDIADLFPVLKSGRPWPEEGVDRQIIDRRRRNARERRCVTGSRFMPNAAMLCDLHIPSGHAARYSADDLRNFYHVIPGTEARALSTPVGYVFRAGEFVGWSCFRADVDPNTKVYIAWCGLAMGDHNAVDWAQEMHMNLLTHNGLLQPRHWLIYPRCLPLNSEKYFEGIMIDDRIGVQIYNRRAASKILYDEVAFEKSDVAYAKVGLERHKGKAKRKEHDGSFWGAELEGKAGLISAPRHKLAALMVLLLQFSRDGVCTIELLEMLTGQLAYVLCFRRALMAILSHTYRQTSADGGRSSSFRMSTWSRNELACAGLLLPMAITNLRAEYHDELLGVDASLEAAGGVGCKLPSSVTQEFWRRTPVKTKGQKLLNHIESDLKGAGDWFEADSESETELPVFEPAKQAVLEGSVDNFTSPQDLKFNRRWKLEIQKRAGDMGAPQASLFVLCFAVIEICGGKGGITKHCSNRGISCGPIIEIQRGWNLLEDGLFDWLLRLSLAGRVWLTVLEPPCTSFSLARKPGVRDMDFPEGYYPEDETTLLGTILGMLCMVLALAQASVGNEFLFEQPGYGHIRCTFYWQWMAHLCADWVTTPFCGYLRGPVIYLKPIIFLFRRGSVFWCKLYKPCRCRKPHTPLEGSLTTAAAAYPDLLCQLIARLVEEHMPRTAGPWLLGAEDIGSGTPGDIIINKDVRTDRRPAVSKLSTVILSECLGWRTNMRYKFKEGGHINLQEAHAFRGVCKRVPGGRRFISLQDSDVVLGVGSKGRSSSQALNRVTLKTATDILGRDLYPKGLHTPTWSLRADHPSRARAVPPPRMCWPHWLFDLCSGIDTRIQDGSAALDALPAVNRPELRWMQVTLGLASVGGFLLGHRGSAATAALGEGRDGDSTAAGEVGDSAGKGGVDVGFPPVCRADAGGEVRGFPSGGSGADLRDGQAVRLACIRQQLEQGAISRTAFGGCGGKPLAEALPNGGMEGCIKVGGAGAQCPADASPRATLSCGIGDVRRVGLAEDDGFVVAGLLRLITSGGALLAQAYGGPAAGRQPRRAADPHPVPQATSRSGDPRVLAHRGVRFAPRLPQDPRLGSEFCEDMAIVAGRARATVAASFATSDSSARSLHTRLSAKRGGYGSL